MASIKDNTLTSVKEGSIVNFKAIALTLLKSLRVNFTPIQLGEGDPSPENIRVINGWTGLNIGKTGKNFFDKNIAINAENYTNQGAYGYKYTDPIYLAPNTTYTLKSEKPNAQIEAAYLVVYVFSGENITVNAPGRGYSLLNNISGTTKAAVTSNVFTFTTGPTGAIRFGINKQLYEDYQSAIDSIFTVSNFQIEPGSSATAYVPSVGIETISVSWQTEVGTVYGGYIDIVKGKLVATIIVANVIKDSNVKFSLPRANQPQIIYNFEDNNLPIGANKNILFYSHGTLRPRNTAAGNYPQANAAVALPYNTTTERINIGLPTNITNMEEYLTWLENVGGTLQVSYELETPILYDITPQEVKTLIGINSIYSNADSVNVEYYNLESLNLYKQRFKANQPYLQTASGSVANFLTALKAPLKKCKVYFLPIQEGSGDPSPENIRPISGWTGLDIVRSNENLLPTDAIYCGKLIADGEEGTLRNSVYHTYCIPAPQGIFYMSKSSNGIVQLCLTDEIPQAGVQFWDGKSYTYYRNREMYNEVGHKYLAIMAGNTDEYDSYEKAFVSRELRMGMQANLPYVTPTGTTYPITFPISAGTVYGGYVDLVRGKIVADRSYRTFDGSERWVLYSNHCFYLYNNMPDAFRNSNRLICSHFKSQVGPWTGSESIVGFDSGYRLSFVYADIDHTIESWTAFLSEQAQTGTPVQIAYELNEPIEYLLDPVTIKTLKGINNIWSNTNGNILTKYWTYDSLAKRKTFTWNQWVPLLISENWQPQNADYSTLSIDNNIATINIIQDVTAVYQSSMKSKKTNVPWILDHKYYIRQDINPSLDSEYVIIRYNSWVGGKRCLKDEWTTLKVVTTSTTTGSNTIYLGYCSVIDQSLAGKVTKVKNPMIIDLTQMFGEGNEPTLLEFESLCARNGIDLTQYQPYDEGSTVNWYV